MAVERSRRAAAVVVAVAMAVAGGAAAGGGVSGCTPSATPPCDTEDAPCAAGEVCRAGACVRVLSPPAIDDAALPVPDGGGPGTDAATTDTGTTDGGTDGGMDGGGTDGGGGDAGGGDAGP